MFNAKVLDNVSKVFPDLEIIKKSTLDKFSFFLKFKSFSSSKSLKNKIFF